MKTLTLIALLILAGCGRPRPPVIVNSIHDAAKYELTSPESVEAFMKLAVKTNLWSGLDKLTVAKVMAPWARPGQTLENGETIRYFIGLAPPRRKFDMFRDVTWLCFEYKNGVVKNCWIEIRD
jgi:hypothetical protein